MDLENPKLREYLLGNLPEKIAEEIDLRVISDKSLEDELNRAEDELIEEYLEEALTPREIELFHGNFLVSDERETHLRHILLLKRHAREAESKKDSKQTQVFPSETFFQKAYRFFQGNLRPSTAVLSVIILGVAIVVGWQLFFHNVPVSERASLENEFTALNRKDLGDLSLFQNVSVESLSPGTYRDSGSIKSLPARELTDTILFRLPLPMGVDSERLFTANLIKEDMVIFSLRGLPSYGNPGGKELRLILPSSLLKKGDYKISIRQESSSDLVIGYPFTVR